MKVIVLVSPILLVALSAGTGATLWEAIVLHFFWIIFGPLFVFVAMPLSYRMLARKAWRGRVNVPAREFTVSEEGLSIADNGSPASIAWAEIRKVAETPEFMLFFLSMREAVYCPIGELPAETLMKLRGIVRRNLGDRADLAGSVA